MKTNNLQLSLKKQWFDMTKEGVKLEDYRDVNEYWIKRLIHPTDEGVKVTDVKHYLGGGEKDPFKSEQKK